MVGADHIAPELDLALEQGARSLRRFLILRITIHAALGTNPSEELYDGARPVPLTDGGRPIAKLFPTA